MQKHQDPASVIVASSVKPKYSLILTLGINRLLHNLLQKKPSLELLRWHSDVCFSSSTHLKLDCQDARVQVLVCTCNYYAYFVQRFHPRLFQMLQLFISPTCHHRKEQSVCVVKTSARVRASCSGCGRHVCLIHTRTAHLKLGLFFFPYCFTR